MRQAQLVGLIGLSGLASTVLVGCSLFVEDRPACRASSECDGDGGFCQPTAICSLPDPDCASRHRYVDDAPSELASECVPGDVVSELVLRLPFDEGAGGVVYDDSPSGAEGALVDGVTWIDDAIAGYAMHFDGDRGRIEVSGEDTLFGEASFSGFVWVRSADPTIHARIMGRFYDDSSVFWLSLSEGRPVFESYDAGRTFRGADPGDLVIADDAWHHVGFAVDKEASEVRLYVDGRFWPVAAITPIDAYGGETDSGQYRFMIGAQHFDPIEPLPGDVDDLWLFRRALADSDVQLLYQRSGAARDP